MDAALASFLQRSQPVGRHWACPATTIPMCARLRLLSAAACVTRTAQIDQTLLRQNFVLSWRLVAPGPWVDACGQLNASVVRFLMLGVLQQLVQFPGASARELSQQSALLET